MWGMAARLSGDTIAGAPGNAAEMAAGKGIFEAGILATEFPACNICHGICHGASAEGLGAVPRLVGQQRSYLENQHEAFASSARANEILHENSKNMTARQISTIAAYLAAQ
jgi:cytochrome c553